MALLRKSSVKRLLYYFRNRKRLLLLLTLVTAFVWVISPSSHQSVLTGASMLYTTRTSAALPKQKFGVFDVAKPYMPSSAWETPFSFSVSAADSDIAVLPPLEDRCPVYAYFDPDDAAHNELNATIERDIIERWRRAFWALGFKPVLLGIEDAKRNPRFQELAAVRNLGAKARSDILKFLAWENSATGMMVDYRVFPMTTRPNHKMLMKLRSCQFNEVSIYKDLGESLLTGAHAAVTYFLDKAFETGHRGNILGYLSEVVTVKNPIEHFVYYSPRVVSSKYAGLDPSLLPDLINSHLHSTWISRFSDGIAIINPFESSSRIMTYPALATAYTLATCPPVEFEQYCPPGRQTCYQCSKSLNSDYIKMSPTIPNTGNFFSLVTIAHPLTQLGLVFSTSTQITANLVRRKTLRDVFVKAISSDIIDEAIGSADRLLELKQIAARNYDVLDNIYLTVFEDQFELSADCLLDSYLEWALGFTFDHESGQHLNKITNANPTSILSQVKYEDLQYSLEQCLPSSEIQVFREDSARIGVLRQGVHIPLQPASEVVDGAREKIGSSSPDIKRLRKAIEGWNMADSELWRFVRALNQRITLEPTIWLSPL
ncbi:uncharacterized protein V1516DRAFT_121294 [Lipomyces oligophaga]|uniref:uncharacterized protein n=1 Tax=Lipomyces oligophaga TaxID=45792 RepID=UPI0034CD7DCF